MSQETRVIQMVAKNLERAAIPYMITGSIATNFYALPRMTRDIDIVVEINNEDIQKIVDLFGKDFYVDIESVRDAVQSASMFNIIENESLVKIDFIIRKNEPYRKVEFERRRQVKLSGEKIWIVSIEDLILSKLIWAKDSLSGKQVGDVKNILASGNKIDHEYLEKYIKTLNLSGIYSKVKE